MMPSRPLLLLFLMFAACDKAAAPPPGPPEMSAAERERATEACRAYLDRLCACAQNDPSLANRCELSRAQPEAVALHRDLLDGKGPKGPLNAEERALTEMSLRKIVAACVKGDAELDPRTCPRR
jgi:hypothetical protein